MYDVYMFMNNVRKFISSLDALKKRDEVETSKSLSSAKKGDITLLVDQYLLNAVRSL